MLIELLREEVYSNALWARNRIRNYELHCSKAFNSALQEEFNKLKTTAFVVGDTMMASSNNIKKFVDATGLSYVIMEDLETGFNLKPAKE
jgi:post-segregation antitoxin (ccd killing protein)